VEAVSWTAKALLLLLAAVMVAAVTGTLDDLLAMR
jgi:hypothetical protein